MSAPAGEVIERRDRLPRDFQRLWGAYSVSELGSALGAGALPLIAVLVLEVTAFQVSVLAAVSAIAAAAIALPLGSFVEFRRKRSMMITFVALGSVPLSASLGLLTFTQLCVVGVVQTTANIVFGTASGAHLKALVPQSRRIEANSRFETTFWTATSVRPPLSGLLISWLGATVTLPDSHLARVTTAWSISSKTVQPIFVVAGGALAAMTTTRIAIGAAAVLLLFSALLLPWREGERV